MTVRDGFNRSVDAMLGLPRVYYTLALGLVVLLAGSCWLRSRDNGLREDGAQTVRDSLAATVSLHLHHKVDSAKVRADSAVHAARDTANNVQRASQAFTQRRATLAPLPAVTALGDTITLNDTAYALPHPIAVWVMAANVHMYKQDSLIAQAAEIINVGIPKMRAGYELALSAKDSVITASDSLNL